MTTHSAGVKTLAAPLEPGLAEQIPTDLVSRILGLLREQFDYVVVDTPPAFTDHVLAIFDQTDVLALIATLDIPALKNLNLTLETLQLLNYPRERWRVVINRSDSKVGLLLSEVEKSLRIPIAGQIPSSRDVPTSINRGKPIVLENARHPVSASIFTFAESSRGDVAARQRQQPVGQEAASDETKGAPRLMTLADRLAQARRDRDDILRRRWGVRSAAAWRRSVR